LLHPASETIIEELEIVPHGTLGHLRITVPAGHHAVLVRFEDTPPRRLGALASAASLLLVVGILLIRTEESNIVVGP
jgi:hypothetical protein